MKRYIKWSALFLSILLAAVSVYSIFSTKKAIEEKQIQKEKLLWCEHIAFMEISWQGKEFGKSDYISVDNINKIRLQIRLYAYEDYTGKVVTVKQIIDFLESEMNEKRYSTKTCENNPEIKDFVDWAMTDYYYYDGGIERTYFHNFYNCLVEYKEANGLTEDSSPPLSFLTLEELAQLREKLKNPDYELTIEVPSKEN